MGYYPMGSTQSHPDSVKRSTNFLLFHSAHSSVSLRDIIAISLQKKNMINKQTKYSTKGTPQIWFLAKVGNLDQQGGGLTESQVFIEIVQNQICLVTVWKCDETHDT